MFGDLGYPELIIILVIVVLLFGVGRISAVSGELGAAIRNFRSGLNGDIADEKKTEAEKAKENAG